MTAELQAQPIELAQAGAFRLGPLEVRPASLEIVFADAGREALEPRVMQVLVVLHEHAGEIVSRERLNELCWGGRVVGDDALQRCISRLRKLGRAHNAFDIENVRGVGLRLVQPQASARPGRSRRPWAIAAVLLAVLVLGLAGVLGWRTFRPPAVSPAPSVAVGGFSAPAGDPAARDLADKLAGDIRGVLVDNLFETRVENRPRGPKADLTLGGTVARDGGRWRIHATLTHRNGAQLWVRDYDRPIAEAGPLRDQVVVGATESVLATLEILRQPVKLDSETLALFVRGQELAVNQDPARPLAGDQALEAGLARAPTMGLVRGTLAFGLVMGMDDSAPPQDRARIRAQARQEIDRAIRDSPHAGNAYDALYWLTRGWDWGGDLVAAEDVLLKGIAAAPDSARIFMRECRLLGEVGRNQAALPYCVRAVALRPMAAHLTQPLASALYRVGRRDSAKQAIETFARYHPDHPFVQAARFGMRLDDGEFDEALRLLHSPQTRPQDVGGAVRAMELLIEARRSGAPQDAERAVAALRNGVANERLDSGYLIVGATQLGHVDAAFAALDRVGPAGFNSVYPNVFGSGMAALHKDPRFWVVAAKGGYLRYWRTRGIWPDFCQDPNVPVDCAAAAKRAGV